MLALLRIPAHNYFVMDPDSPQPNNMMKRQSCGSFRNVLSCGCPQSSLISNEATFEGCDSESINKKTVGCRIEQGCFQWSGMCLHTQLCGFSNNIWHLGLCRGLWFWFLLTLGVQGASARYRSWVGLFISVFCELASMFLKLNLILLKNTVTPHR